MKEPTGKQSPQSPPAKVKPIEKPKEKTFEERLAEIPTRVIWPAGLEDKPKKV